MIDLHTHSTASDGSYAPETLVEVAAQAGITKLALTDHDSVDGIRAAQKAAKMTDLELISGAELSVRWQSQTLHIVGLGLDIDCPVLSETLKQAQQTRIDRGRRIGERLEKFGVNNAYQLTCEIAGSALVGRSHFARMLVESGFAKDAKQVFKRYMVSGKPGYAPADWISLEQCLEAIHAAGGIAVVAHPGRYKLSARKLQRLLDEFSELGGGAMEVISGRSTPGEIELMARLAQRYKLAASTGSDFHGPDKPWLKLGCLAPLPSQCEPVWQRAPLWHS